MSWLTLGFDVAADRAEALSEALLDIGALSAGVEDAEAGTAAEVPLFGEPGAPAQAYWAHCLVSALFPADAPLADQIPQALAAAGLPADTPWSSTPVAEQDWVRATQAQFDPICISARIWIIPSWHEPRDQAAINIRLDPGLAFGTGSHPTTRLCLHWLESRVQGGERVLDYGCGSGILAIAAAKLGAGEVVGVDIDPQAVQSARDNAAVNQVTAEFLDAECQVPAAADLVVANILANPLRALAPLITAATRVGGQVALAGLLEAQVEEVTAAYRPAFELQPFARDEGWVCLAGTRLQ